MSTSHTEIISGLLLSLFSYPTGGSSASFLPESPAKEKVNDYDVTEHKYSAGDQPNVYTPLKGNSASFVHAFLVM